ncbi:MAG: flagellar biosynthesis anti-sigma factor FlgM [Zetaproteobacteria bacterium]|nr:flagellar biosynthesis anti-sigma factor FlgM [Zetaproteobacteria bacterium]
MVRISGTGSIGTVQKSTGTRKKGKASSKKSTDRVQVSDAETLREVAHTMMADMPDVRLEKIEGIRDALEKGTFQCNSKKVATQIVRNALSERTW